jgi:SAM-dependent methyltransferase
MQCSCMAAATRSTPTNPRAGQLAAGVSLHRTLPAKRWTLNMKKTQSCPVCASDYTLYVQEVYGQRSMTKFPQFHCMDCKSFFNFSGYRETDGQKEVDFEYLRDRQAHISKLQNELALEILSRAPGVSTCCEIGFGTGLFLKACTYFGVREYGFEVNPYSARYAREVVGVNCEEGLFTESHEGRYDMIAAIGVFEHIENPRGLFATMASHLNRDGVIYINVPFVERAHWRYLWMADEAGSKQPPDPFYDNDVHIIHYSVAGLMRMGQNLGARSSEYFVSRDVVDNSAGGAYPGVLFRF